MFVPGPPSTLSARNVRLVANVKVPVSLFLVRRLVSSSPPCRGRHPRAVPRTHTHTHIYYSVRPAPTSSTVSAAVLCAKGSITARERLPRLRDIDVIDAWLYLQTMYIHIIYNNCWLFQGPISTIDSAYTFYVARKRFK